MLRAFMIIGILAACAFMANWFTIDRTAEETTIRFNRDEIRSDTSRAIAKGKELFREESEPFRSEGQGGFSAESALEAVEERATQMIPEWEQSRQGAQGLPQSF